MLDQFIKAYEEAVFDTDREKALKTVQDALSQGFSPEDVVFELVIPTIEKMEKSMSEGGEGNLIQHFFTAQIGSEVTEEMIARFKEPSTPIGKVVIGTAVGDLHTLGKRIVIGCLKARMIDAVDLGVNVPPERFVDEAIAHNAPVIAISAMMVHTARGENGCLKVRQILKERGLEDQIKIIVGGAPFRFDPELYKIVGADDWAGDGITGSERIIDLIKGVKT